MRRNEIKPIKLTKKAKQMRSLREQYKYELDLWAMQREEQQRRENH